MERNKFAAQERYEKKNGITVKAFKVKKELADQFKETCERNGISQSAAITQLMQGFIRQHKD